MMTFVTCNGICTSVVDEGMYANEANSREGRTRRERRIYNRRDQR
jgi:hypothetical protein